VFFTPFNVPCKGKQNTKIDQLVRQNFNPKHGHQCDGAPKADKMLVALSCCKLYELGCVIGNCRIFFLREAARPQKCSNI
jgi:hypothetical protein